MKNQIEYSEIIALGFEEELCHDNVYFNQFGFQYAIITIDLTNKIHIDWAKETRQCEMIRINKKGDIMSRLPIRGLDHLKELICFFKEDKHKINY